MYFPPPDILAMLLAGLLCVGLTLRLWLGRGQPLFRTLSLESAVLAIGAVSVVAELHSEDLDWKYVLTVVKAVAVQGSAFVEGMLAVEHTGAVPGIRKRF